MSKKIHWYIVIALAALITLITLISQSTNGFNPIMNLKVGQIAEKDIISPIQFNVLRQPAGLRSDVTLKSSGFIPVYKQSDDVKFNTLKKLDSLIQIMGNRMPNTDSLIYKYRAKEIGLTITPSTIRSLLNEKYRQRFYNILSDQLSNVMNVGIYGSVGTDTMLIYNQDDVQAISTKSLYTTREAEEAILVNVTDQELKMAASEILPQIIEPNLIVDEELTNKEKRELDSSNPAVLGVVQKNEEIVRKNTKISETDLLKLLSLQEALKGTVHFNSIRNHWRAAFGIFLYNLMILFLFFLLIQYLFPHAYNSTRHIAILVAGVLINCVLAFLLKDILHQPTLLLPFGISVVLIAIVFSSNIGIIYAFANYLVLLPVLNWEVFHPLLLLVSSIAAMLTMRKMKDKHDYFIVGLFLLGDMALLVLIFSLINGDPLSLAIRHFFQISVNAIICILVLIPLTPWIEKKLNITSKQVLLELLDFNHPLMKKLANNASGTYHHSLVVGNLAERAAEAIGANPLLARVGSYYHDIGKIVNANIYTENNEESEAFFVHHSPQDCARMIRDHVTEGVDLARKNKLPKAIVEIIQTHHGTGTIRYFLQQAEKMGAQFDINQFRYFGPLPRTREAALVMIADIAESTTKSLPKASKEVLRQVLSDTILRLIRDNQLADAPITMRELNTVQEVMLPILESIYRKRLEYPEDKGLKV